MRQCQVRQRMIRGVLATIGVLWLAGVLALGNVPVSAAGIQVPQPGQSENIDKIKRLGKLRVGIAVAAPWLLQDPKTGQYFGVSIDIAKRVASAAGVGVEFVPSNWDVFIAGLQSGQFEISAAPASVTAKRLEAVDFVNYTDSGFCYLVRKNNTKINSLADLNNPSVRIGTLTGTGGEHQVMAKYPKAKYDSVVAGPGVLERSTDLLAGRIDVAPFDSPSAIVFEHDFPKLKILPGGAANCIKHPDVPAAVGVALRKNDPAFKSFLEAVIAPMKKSGEIDRLIAKYSTLEYMRAHQ
jgi:polar amino acid transport system substrate-binding protein